QLKGQLDRIDEFRSLKRQWTEAAETSRRLERVAEEIKRQQQALASIDEEASRLPASLRDASDPQVEDALDRLRKLEAEVSQILSDEELDRRSEKLKAEFADVWSWPDDAEDRIEGYRRATESRREAELRAAQVRAEREKCRPTPDITRRLLVAGAVGAVVALGLAIALSQWIGPLWGVVLGLLFGAGGAFATGFYYRPMIVPEAYETTENQYRECLAAQEQTTQEVEQAWARIDFCEQDDLETLSRLLDRWKEACRRRNELEQLRKANEERRRKTSVEQQPEPLREWLAHFGGIAETIQNVETHRRLMQKRRVAAEKIATALETNECASLEDLELKVQALADRRAGFQSKINDLIEASAAVEEIKDAPAAELDALVTDLNERLKAKEAEQKYLSGERDRLQKELARAE
ncbi:MAG: hypothetical protein D6741_22020, partial [Planctomycetota bacterium]